MSRKAVSVLVLGAMFLSVGWYFLLWGPENDSLASAQKRLNSLKSQQSELQSKISRLGRIDATKLQTDVNTISAAIPKDPELDVFLHQLQDHATTDGLNLSSVAPTPPAVPTGPDAVNAVAGVSEIKITMGVIGSYQQISHFIDDLDGLDRLTVVDSISLVQDTSKTDSINGQLAIRIFTRAAPVDPRSVVVGAGGK